MSTPTCLPASLALVVVGLGCGPAPTTPTPPPPPTATVPSHVPPRLSAPASAVAPLPSPPIIYRVGNGVREPVEISRVQPTYPEICRAYPVQGMPILEAVIDELGAVASVRPLHPDPARPLCPQLEAACVKALSQWRYRPATLNGTPVPVYLTVTVSVHPR